MGISGLSIPPRSDLRVIVCTTVNPPTEALYKFINICKKPGSPWVLMVVGDLKTPHNYQELADAGQLIYVSPKMQEAYYPELSRAIGWNTSLRRNIGFALAYSMNCSIMASVDDDNIPYQSWGEDLLISKTVEVNEFTTSGPVDDPFSVVNSRGWWQRGFPIQLVRSRKLTFVGKKIICPQIQASFWDGDPDIDAVVRLIQNTADHRCIEAKPFTMHHIAPFNSQNTFFHHTVIPHYLLLPAVGRIDDIWGSYELQNHWPTAIVYTSATVFHARHEHDLVRDMSLEMFGYEHLLDYIKGNFTLPPEAQSLASLYTRSVLNGPQGRME